jgi:hypothetical protein
VPATDNFDERLFSTPKTFNPAETPTNKAALFAIKSRRVLVFIRFDNYDFSEVKNSKNEPISFVIKT